MKYKEVGNGWYCQINEDGGKGQSFNKKNSPKRFKEMKDWEALGNKIEAQCTEDELKAKDLKEEKDALTSQNSTLQSLLDSSDRKVTRASPHSEADQQKWIVARVAWRKQLKDNVLTDIHEKPF
jgi:hypothetical protein